MNSKSEPIEREEVFILFDQLMGDCIKEFVLENDEKIMEKFCRKIKAQAETYKITLKTSRNENQIKNFLKKNDLYKLIEYVLWR